MSTVSSDLPTKPASQTEFDGDLIDVEIDLFPASAVTVSVTPPPSEVDENKKDCVQPSEPEGVSSNSEPLIASETRDPEQDTAIPTAWDNGRTRPQERLYIGGFPEGSEEQDDKIADMISVWWSKIDPYSHLISAVSYPASIFPRFKSARSANSADEEVVTDRARADNYTPDDPAETVPALDPTSQTPATWYSTLNPIPGLRSVASQWSSVANECYKFTRAPMSTVKSWASAPLSGWKETGDRWLEAAQPLRTAAVAMTVGLGGMMALRQGIGAATDLKRCLDEWSRPYGTCWASEADSDWKGGLGRTEGSRIW